jgi:diguanylate cyclase (GGDEF)-like protein
MDSVVTGPDPRLEPGAGMGRWSAGRGRQDGRHDRRQGARSRDPLTGLAQRDDLYDRGPELLARAESAGRPATLLVVDLDGFKSVNDAAGHHVGDRVLAAVAARLEAAVDPDDLVVRLGGDEFAVLTGPLPHEDAGPARARAVIEAVAEPVEVDDLRIAVAASVGLATYGVDGTTVEKLLRAADQAMYVAKSAGPGQWRSSTPDGHDQDRVERLLRDLGSGRAARELVVHYQPQVALDDGRVVGFEALVRWDHPELGLLPPRDFVPLAERSGLMAPITEAVLERSLGDLHRLQAAAPGARLSINVTRRHILGRGLTDDLRAHVRRQGLSPRHVVLEITEPVTRASSETAETFASLSRGGFEVSIRGFGTARSSLTALWSNPAVREVKLDRSIVGALQEVGRPDPEAVRLLRALTSAARGLGIRVVAEGVEDRASVRGLRDLRCDVVQGFWLCPPAGLDEVVAWCSGWPERRASHLD